MNILLSEYIRSLKERDELDVLLPLLLLSMGIVPISKPQIGIRQLGVDFSAIGPDPETCKKTLFLFVIKKGDVARSDWDSGPQSVRPTLNEIFDTYLRSHISAEHKELPIRVVVAFSGDWKQDIEHNWTGYVDSVPNKNISLERWNADRIAFLIEKNMLDENVFTDLDKHDIRQALALAGEVDFTPHTLHRLLLRHLDIEADGHIAATKKKRRIPGTTIANFATDLFCVWSNAQGNARNAYLASERALLWIWHKVKHSPSDKGVNDAISFALKNYDDAGNGLFVKLEKHYFVKNGLSSCYSDNFLLSLALFEQIGILATLGLRHHHSITETDSKISCLELANALCALIENNSSSGSPRLDEHVIDLNLAILFLLRMDKKDEVIHWLTRLVSRIAFSFRFKQQFPLNNSDELIFDDSEKDSSDESEKYPNWLLPNLADWCFLLELNELYEFLAYGAEKHYPWVCQQLWHPTVDVFEDFYFKPVVHSSGIADAPLLVTAQRAKYGARIGLIKSNPDFDVISSSPAFKSSLPFLDFIACRHFRTPVAPFVIYNELR